MPVEVFFKGPDADVGPVDVSGALERVCEESVELLAALIREELLKSARRVVITEHAKELFPVLRNFPLLVEKYLKCFSVTPVEGGFQLEVSREALREQGLPEVLPGLLEYGSETGISAMTHLSTAWMRFQREVIPRLTREILKECH